MKPRSVSRRDDIPVGLGAQLRRHAPRFAAGFVLLALYQAGQLLFDLRLMAGLNSALEGSGAGALRVGVELVVIAVLAFGIRVISRMAVFNAGRIAEYELRKALLAKLHQLGPAFYGRMSSGEIMSRVTNDLVQLRLLLGFGVLNVMNTAFGLISSFAVTLAISWKLTLASLSILPLLLLVTRSFARQMYGKTKDAQGALGKLSEVAQSSIAGVRVVKSFSFEDRELERFDRSNERYLRSSLALARLRGSLGPIMQSITALGVLIVFWYGGRLMIAGELSEGGFLAFFRALGRLTWPLISLGFVVGLVQRGRASYARLAEIYQATPDVVDGSHAPPLKTEGHLVVKGLSFWYGDQKVLDEVSLEVKPGTTLAIVGRTGSGKSTLAALLARLQPTPHGAVYLDGTDLCDLPLTYVRRVIGFAQQTPYLFSTTVGRNIAYSLDDPDAVEGLAKAEKAAVDAHVFEEVRALPDGFDTVVGERGVQLSGGQRQRVALARAFVYEPRLLILDDPLSAVDARTEHRILQSIEEQAKHRSVILVTHRVAAAARCDHIVVLDRGRVVEQGSHAELCSAGGLYSLFSREQQIETELERLGDGEAAE